MKKLLFTLAAMLMTANVFADNYLYIEDFEISQDFLAQTSGKAREMTLDVKAHFDQYVSAFMVWINSPEDITNRGALAGEAMTQSGYTRTGNPIDRSVELSVSEGVDIMIAAWQGADYYYPEGTDPDEDDPVSVGSVKWAPGEYNMFTLKVRFAQEFTGGDIMVITEPSCSGTDPRGECCPKNEHFEVACHVTVVNNVEVIQASSIELNQTTAVITENNTLQLTATIMPEDATNKTVVWTSSDETVANVDENGLVAAVAPGTATITATTTDGSALSASCIVTVNSLSANNYFIVPDLIVYHGDSVVIPVQLSNEENILAFQTDIYLPEGFTLVTDEDDEPIITPSSRLTSDHVIMADRLNDNCVRVICYTPRSKVINGNEGDLFYITVVTPEYSGGDYTILLRNSLLTTSEYLELSIPDVGSTLHVNTYIPGDVNNSRTVNITDIVFAAQYILQRNPSPFIFEAADMNGDGNITVTDIMLIARLIMTPSMNAPKRMPAITSNGDCMSGENITLATGETRKVSIVLDNAMDYSAFQLDLMLPDGMTASNFQLTDRAGSHALDVETIDGGKLRALCYSPAIEAITGHSGALLTFDVTAGSDVKGDIVVDGIELVTTDCQTMLLDAFTIGVNNVTSVNELATGKTVVGEEYFNLAGQRIDCPDGGVTLVVTTYTDGTRIATKVIR